MANNRLFYAVQALGIAPDGSSTFTRTNGVQSLGITTTFDLQQVFELGQLAIYENIEDIPDIEVTAEKVLDGFCPLYLLSTQGAGSSTLSGRSTKKCIAAVSFYSDQQDSASGTPLSQVTMSGLFSQSVGYTFPVDAPCTENITWVGNHKLWRSGNFTFSGGYNNTDVPVGSGGIARRENVRFIYSNSTLDANGMVSQVDATVLPRDLPGISASGTNIRGADGFMFCKVQNISCSTDLGREELFELGTKTTYFRFVTFPTEVTTDIEIISLSGDFISGTEGGIYGDGNNTRDQSIRVATDEGLRLNLGTKNRLQSVSQGGGDAGGGNVTLTYSYRNFNDFQVMHTADIDAALRPSA